MGSDGAEAHRACVDHTRVRRRGYSQANANRRARATGGARSAGRRRRARRCTVRPSADVAIVGAGYTGLWSAYYLKRAQPSLEIVVLEREHRRLRRVGPERRLGLRVLLRPGARVVRTAHRHDDGFTTLQRAMFETVEEIAAVLAEHANRRRLVKGGHLAVALNGAQLPRLRQEVAHSRAHGLGERGPARADGRRAAAARARRRRRRRELLPPRRAHAPGQAATGLAATVEGSGSKIYESTPVSAIRPHEALTPRGRVDARWVVRATEGYTAALPGLRRALVPINSSMIVTEPLAPARVGADRLGRRRGARRRSARVRLPAAHGRWAHRDRRSRRALSLRLAHGRTRRHRGRRLSRACARSSARCSRRQPARPSITPGRVSSARPATGACRSTPIRARDSRGPAATSARALPPRTSRAERFVT